MLEAVPRRTRLRRHLVIRQFRSRAGALFALPCRQFRMAFPTVAADEDQMDDVVEVVTRPVATPRSVTHYGQAIPPKSVPSLVARSFIRHRPRR